ncbi:MAG: hypothetical protein ACLFWB_05840, partial [Armatimonadota bacterium]
MVDGNDREDREPEDPLSGHEQDDDSEAEAQGADMYDDLFTPERDEPQQEPEQPQSGGGGTTSTGMMVFMAVLVLGLIAAGAFAYKTHLDRTDADRALRQAIDTLPAVAGPAGRNLDKQVADLRSAAEKGQYATVINGLQGLAVPPRAGDDLPPGMRGPQDDEEQGGGFELPEGPLPDEAYAELPEGARPFFKQHEELFKEFALQCERSRVLRDNGVEVDDLRQMRDSIIEAARLDQEEKVKRLVAQMTKRVAQKAGGGKKQAPEELRKPLEEFAKTARKARSERRDIEPAMKLLQQAEQAAEKGEMEKARSLIARATESAKNAKKVTTQRQRVRVPRGDGENQRQQQSAALPQVILQGLLGMVSAEEADLAAAYKNIENAKIAVREKNADQVKSILDDALERLKNIGERRREFNQQMQKLMAEGPPQEREEGREADGAEEDRGRDPRQRADGGSRLQQMITTGAVKIFEKIRGLSDEEFEQKKDELAGEVFALLR